MPEKIAEVYTDGSCHTQLRIGTWIAIILTSASKKTLSGVETDTTHNRMELIAVIKSIEYILLHHRSVNTIRIHTDSQYVTGLPARKEKIVANDFLTAQENNLQNADLVKRLYEVLSVVTIDFVKLKAHQKKSDTINYNREADILARQLLRKAVDNKKPAN